MMQVQLPQVVSCLAVPWGGRKYHSLPLWLRYLHQYPYFRLKYGLFVPVRWLSLQGIPYHTIHRAGNNPSSLGSGVENGGKPGISDIRGEKHYSSKRVTIVVGLFFVFLRDVALGMYVHSPRKYHADDIWGM